MRSLFHTKGLGMRPCTYLKPQPNSSSCTVLCYYIGSKQQACHHCHQKAFFHLHTVTETPLTCNVNMKHVTGYTIGCIVGFLISHRRGTLTTESNGLPKESMVSLNNDLLFPNLITIWQYPVATGLQMLSIANWQGTPLHHFRSPSPTLSDPLHDHT